MALRFVEGFDWVPSTAKITYKWNSYDSSAFPGLAAGRFGGQYWGMAPRSIAPGLSKTLTAQATWVIGFAWQLKNMPLTTNSLCLVSLQDGGTVHVDLRVIASGFLRLYNGDGSTIATSANSVAINTWYYVELKVTIGDAGVGQYELRVNGTSVGWLPSAGGDTRNGGNPTADTIVLGRYSSSSTTYGEWFDDLYMADGQAGINDFLGDSRVQVLLPNGAGDYTNFTASPAVANYLNTDETLVDDDTTYNYSSTVGHKDAYEMSNLAAGYTIHAVAANTIVKKSDAGARTCRVLARSAADVDYNGNTESPSAASYLNFQKAWETNPAGGAWDANDLNLYQFGVEVVA